MKLFLFTTGLTSYTYDDENKLIYTNHSSSITKYAYDGMGNTISGGGSTMMTYDYERRLTSITLPSGDTVTYKYLPDGTRIMRANNTHTEYYLYDREGWIGTPYPAAMPTTCSQKACTSGSGPTVPQLSC